MGAGAPGLAPLATDLCRQASGWAWALAQVGARLGFEVSWAFFLFSPHFAIWAFHIYLFSLVIPLDDSPFS